MVHLMKNAVKRRNLNYVSVSINKENKKGIVFFERFGFKLTQKTQNGMKGNKDDAVEEKSESNDNKLFVQMRLDLRIYRSSILVLVKKQLKQATEQKESEKQPQSDKQNDTNS